MKLHKFVVTLVAAALLPTLAHAGDSSDSIRASFDRDVYAGYFVEALPGANTVDPLEAWSGSIYPAASIKQASTVNPQDVWSGAAYYPYASNAQAVAADPLDAWSGNYEPVAHAAAVAAALHAQLDSVSDLYGG